MKKHIYIIFLTIMSLLKGVSFSQEPTKQPSQSQGGAASANSELAKALSGGLFLQEDSGAVMEFKADGTLAGWPLAGKWWATDDGRVTLSAKEESLNFQLKENTKEAITLTSLLDGEHEPTTLRRLSPLEKPDMKKLSGYYLIRFMRANQKEANLRAAKLEDTGHFRTKEGGFYFRLTTGNNGENMAYASGDDDKTLAVKIYSAGSFLVIFDRLPDPGLFASCYKGGGTEPPPQPRK